MGFVLELKQGYTNSKTSNSRYGNVHIGVKGGLGGQNLIANVTDALRGWGLKYVHPKKL